MLRRPPDPDKNEPPLSSNTLTEQNHITQTKDATKFDQTVNGTVPKIASISPAPATDFSSLNLEILNRAKDSSPQITLTHKNLDHSALPIGTTEGLEFSGHLNTGTYGVPTTVPLPTPHENRQNNYNNQFTALTSNFTQPNIRNHSPVNIDNVGPSHVRSNATDTPHFSVIPTIQQLNHKFNHNAHNSAKQAYPVTKFTIQPTVSVNAKETTAPLPPSVVPSYATWLRASQSLEETRIDLVPPVVTTKQGLPAVLFNREDFMIKWASKRRYTLIGKFSSTMPKMEVIRSSLSSQLQIKGECKVTHFNSTHVYIDLDNEFDHAIVWNKERIYIDGRLMRLLVWTPTFRPEEETTFCPVWVVLPQLPWHCFSMPFVSKLLQPVDRVLYFDAASIKRSRGSVEKVKIEIDITKPRPPHIWLGFPHDEGDVYGEGRWQELQFKSIPEYCQYCKHQGHSETQCKVKFRDERENIMAKKHDNDRLESAGPSTDVVMLQKSNAHPDSQRRNAFRGNPPVQKQHYVAKPSTQVQQFDQHGGKPNHQDLLFIQHTEGKKQGGRKEHHGVVPVKMGIENKPMELHCKNDFAVLTEEYVDVVAADCKKSAAIAIPASGRENHKDMHGLSVEEINDHPIHPLVQLTDPLTENGKNPVNHVVSAAICKGVPIIAQEQGVFGSTMGQPWPHSDVAAKDSVEIIDVDKGIYAPVFSQMVKNNDEPIVAEWNHVKNSSRTHNNHVNVQAATGATCKDNSGKFPGVSATEYLLSGAKDTVRSKIRVTDIGDIAYSGSLSEGVTLPTGNVAGAVESTKEWVLKTFPSTNDSTPQPHQFISENPSDLTTDVTLTSVVTKSSDTATKSEKAENAEVKASSPPPDTATGRKKKMKKQRKNVGAVTPKLTTFMESAGELIQEELTEEEVRKAKIRAWQDAILAKSYAEIPVIESNKEPLNVLENNAAESIPSQESFDPAYAITMGTDSDDTEKGKALAAYVSPAYSGNILIPTARLEVMCKEASKMMKEVGRGFYPVPPQTEFVNEEPDDPAYFLENLFADSHDDQNAPSKDGKSRWNLNAPLFIPNALRQQEPQHAIESEDSKDGPKLVYPNAPSDEVLLQRLDLHDIRGLLQRQNSQPQDLPQKFSSPHPAIIEDGSEYEEEDDESTGYNFMVESRYVDLSPRLEQVCKPKLIKKKRRPLEPKKKEEAPKKPKRVQPARSSKSRSTRRK